MSAHDRDYERDVAEMRAWEALFDARRRPAPVPKPEPLPSSRVRAALRRDIERSLTDEQRARLNDADRQRKAFDRMMRDPGR